MGSGMPARFSACDDGSRFFSSIHGIYGTIRLSYRASYCFAKLRFWMTSGPPMSIRVSRRTSGGPVGGSAPKPPEFSHCTPNVIGQGGQKTGGAAKPRPHVRWPATALGFLSRIALPSAQARGSLLRGRQDSTVAKQWDAKRTRMGMALMHRGRDGDVRTAYASNTSLALCLRREERCIDGKS